MTILKVERSTLLSDRIPLQVIMMLVMGCMVFMVKNMDPEQMKEVEQQQVRASHAMIVMIVGMAMAGGVAVRARAAPISLIFRSLRALLSWVPIQSFLREPAVGYRQCNHGLAASKRGACAGCLDATVPSFASRPSRFVAHPSPARSSLLSMTANSPSCSATWVWTCLTRWPHSRISFPAAMMLGQLQLPPLPVAAAVGPRRGGKSGSKNHGRNSVMADLPLCAATAADDSEVVDDASSDRWPYCCHGHASISMISSRVRYGGDRVPTADKRWA